MAHFRQIPNEYPEIGQCLKYDATSEMAFQDEARMWESIQTEKYNQGA